jgi:ABC-type phosphate transport system permease subunit
MLAARGVWMCLYFSHPDVQMLDGGLSKWTGENLPSQTESTIYKPSNLTTPIDPSSSLPVQVYLWSESAERGFVEKTSATIMMLLSFLIVMNILAVYLRQKFEKRWN